MYVYVLYKVFLIYKCYYCKCWDCDVEGVFYFYLLKVYDFSLGRFGIFWEC